MEGREGISDLAVLWQAALLHPGTQPEVMLGVTGSPVRSMASAILSPSVKHITDTPSVTWRRCAERGLCHPGTQPEAHHGHAGADVARAPDARGTHGLPAQA